MANKKISQLTTANPLTGLEQLPIVQTSATVKTTVSDIASYSVSSSVVTASVSTNIIQFTKGNGSTFNVTVATGSSLQTVTNIGNTTSNSIILNGSIGDAIIYPNDPVETGGGSQPVPSFVSYDASSVDTHKLLPNRLVWIGEESNKTTLIYQNDGGGIISNLVIPAVNGVLTAVRTNEGFVLPISAPGSPITGSIYFDTASAQLKVWNGSWVSIS